MPDCMFVITQEAVFSGCVLGVVVWVRVYVVVHGGEHEWLLYTCRLV